MDDLELSVIDKGLEVGARKAIRISRYGFEIDGFGELDLPTYGFEDLRRHKLGSEQTRR